MIAGDRFNPFPGLRSFEPDEVHLFFGRELQIDELLGRLRKTRFLSVVGASGSGKSSLVRSGLIPSLYSGFMVNAGSSWRIALLRPGGNPIDSLANALNSSAVLGTPRTVGEMGQMLLETTLRRSALGIIEAARHARMPAGDNLLIIVDQFEELFRFKHTHCSQEAQNEAAGFVKLLLAASQQNDLPIYVVLTMRSEFIGQCSAFSGLAQAVNDGQYLVPRMTRDELRLAITGPVAVAGGEIASRLVTRLLNEVADDPDQLPVLQHALMRTWDYHVRHHADRTPIDVADYDAIGTMKDALSLHAEEAYGELANERERQTAESVFKSLTDVTTQGTGIRRPTRIQDLREVAGVAIGDLVRVIDRFRVQGRSFLVPTIDVPLEDGTIVDLSHESLMRVWRRLIDWTDAEARSAAMYRRLSQAALLHEGGEAALWRDPELQLALNWRQASAPTAAWATRYDPNFDRAIAFLEKSGRARDAELAEQERLQRRELVRTRRFNVVVSGAFVVALAFGVFAFTQRNSARTAAETARQEEGRARDATKRAEVEADNARRERASAEEQRDLATKANVAAGAAEQVARQQAGLASLKEAEARVSAEQARLSADRAELNAMQAEENAGAARRNAEEATRRQEEAKTAQTSAENAREQERKAHDEAERLARLSLARALAGQALREWDPSEVEIPAILARQAYQIAKENGADVDDPDLYEALRSSLSRLKADGTQIFRGHDDGVRAIALNRAGTLLATGGDDGTLQIFDLTQPNRPQISIRDRGAAIRSLAINPSATSLGIGMLDGSIRLWDLRQQKPVSSRIPAHTATVSALSFDAAGRLVSASSDGSVKLWNLESNQPPSALLQSRVRIPGIAMGPDGVTLAVASEGGGLMTFDLRAPLEPARSFAGYPQVSAVAISSDGGLLAAGTPDGRIVYWDVRRNAPAVRGTAAQHTSTVTGLAFGGDLLASSSLDGAVKLWRVSDRGIGLDERPIALRGHSGWVWAVALTQDGARVFSAGADRTARSALTHVLPLADAVCGSVSRNLTDEQWSQYVSETIPYAVTCPGLPAAVKAVP